MPPVLPIKINHKNVFCTLWLDVNFPQKLAKEGKIEFPPKIL